MYLYSKAYIYVAVCLVPRCLVGREKERLVTTVTIMLSLHDFYENGNYFDNILHVCMYILDMHRYSVICTASVA